MKQEMNFIKEEKGQAGLETLLIVAGAIMIATVVGLYLKNSITQQGIKAQIEADRNRLISEMTK